MLLFVAIAPWAIFVAIAGGARRAIMFFAGGAFETPWYMRGMEQFLLDLVEAPEIAECIQPDTPPENVMALYDTALQYHFK